jgi:hypothetical protein
MEPLEKLEMLTVVPEIAVFEEGMYEIFDGPSQVGFGSTSLGSPVTKTFTITNMGGGDLTLDPGSLSVPDGFTLVSPFDSTVGPYMSTYFIVQLDASMPGSYSGTLSFKNNDTDENPFDFTITR